MLHQTIYGSINVKRKAYRKEEKLPPKEHKHSVVAIEWAKNPEKRRAKNILH